MSSTNGSKSYVLRFANLSSNLTKEKWIVHNNGSYFSLVMRVTFFRFIHGMITSLSDNNNLFEIPYDNYPITSDLSTISDASISGVSISSFSNASISDASISDEQPIVRSSRPTDRKHKIPY
ncbi:21797_t:CDS:2 [Rhizophagus irregularis]|nr:21797_t:CDS:2 [Rhizophagus irregularis]